MPYTPLHDGDTQTPGSLPLPSDGWRFWEEQVLDMCLYPLAIPDPNQSTESTEASGHGIFGDQPFIQT